MRRSSLASTEDVAVDSWRDTQKRSVKRGKRRSESTSSLIATSSSFSRNGQMSLTQPHTRRRSTARYEGSLKGRMRGAIFPNCLTMKPSSLLLPSVCVGMLHREGQPEFALAYKRDARQRFDTRPLRRMPTVADRK